jgi:DnaJ-domain-containing protein 1
MGNGMNRHLTPTKTTLLITAACGALGLLFNIPGLFIGIVLGYLTGVLFSQIKTNKAICAYFENPGPSAFYEEEPGLASYCALGVYLMSKASPKPPSEDAAITQIASSAMSVFPAGAKITALAESFCRMAYSRLSFLNADLLTESLAARRLSKGDTAPLGEELAFMAQGRVAKQEALYIRQFLDPNYEPLPDERPAEDPYAALELPRSASYEQVKSAFRKLALTCHPDNQSASSSEEEKKLMEEKFIRIRDAYRTITWEQRFV